MASDNMAIIGLLIAIYGALLATVNSVVQVIAHRKDRADVVLKVRPNMSALNDPRYANMKLTLVTAINRGKRPVTICGFSSKLLDSRDEYLLGDIRPTLPHEITESQSITAFVNEGGGDLSQIEYYYVWDSVGRNFRISLVPWYRRLASQFRRKFAHVDRIKKHSAKA
jgi:hypothetical protein